MKIFRDSKLIFWLIVTFSTMFIVVYSFNSIPKKSVSNKINFRVGSKVEYDAVTPAIDFMHRISGSYLAYNGGDFNTWSNETYTIAKNNANNYLIYNGDKNSKTYADWVEIVNATYQLSKTDYTDNNKVIQQTSLLNSLTQELISDVSINNLNNNFITKRGL